MIRNLKFFSSCVGWPRNRVDQLHDMVDSGLEITRDTFLKHVDRDSLADIESGFGIYGPGSCFRSMRSDWHVQYFRGKLVGEWVYWFVHSGIEYVFKDQD